MQASSGFAQPRILVIQNEFINEMRLALEYAGQALDDPDAIREQLADILQQHGIDAAVLDAGLDLGTVASIAGALADMDIPFVLGGPDSQTEMPGYLVAQTMAPELANLTVLAQSILGRPTYH